MKKRKINIYRLVFFIGIAVFVFLVGTLIVDQKTGWFISKEKQGQSELAQSQIRQQRLEAINDAAKDHRLSYKFEVSGDNFLTMPMAPKEEEKVQNLPLTLRSE